MYKNGQGMLSRIGIVVLGMLIGAYAGISWYYWMMAEAAPTNLTDMVVSPSFIGSIVVFIAVSLFFANIALRDPRGSDYLIDMDMELRKVVWPTVMPLFDPKTEAWGSTYIVIVSTILLTIFIYLVDLALKFIVSDNLLTWMS